MIFWQYRRFLPGEYIHSIKYLFIYLLSIYISIYIHHHHHISNQISCHSLHVGAFNLRNLRSVILGLSYINLYFSFTAFINIFLCSLPIYYNVGFFVFILFGILWEFWISALAPSWVRKILHYYFSYIGNLFLPPFSTLMTFLWCRNYDLILYHKYLKLLH